MITLEEIKQNLECSDVYAHKITEYEKVLEDIYYQKLAERRVREAVVEYGY